MLTKKHMERTAQILRDFQLKQNARGVTISEDAYTDLTLMFAYMFEDDNPHFNRQRFLEACAIA